MPAGKNVLQLRQRIAREDNEGQTTGHQGRCGGAGAHAGQAGIDNGDIEIRAFDQRQCLVEPAGDASNLEPRVDKQILEVERDQRLVLDDQNARLPGVNDVSSGRFIKRGV